MSTVLVTGATGFVGRAVCRTLFELGHGVRAAVRGPDAAARLPPRVGSVVVGDIGSTPDWTQALGGVEAVVHLAARVHMMRDLAADPLAEFRRVNAAATEGLARAAAAGGVRRFVFLSSVKVNGDGTERAPFTESDAPAPADPYGLSKWEAEQALRRVEAETGLEVVVLRPPLVYGPGVGANFLRLLRTVKRGLPLPLGAVRNRRSLIFVENLADAVATALTHPAAAGETFLVSDGPPRSTPDLIRGVAQALGRRPRLLPVPEALLRAAGRATGRAAAVDRLCGSLEVDDSRVRTRLGWRPPVSPADGLGRTAEWFRNQ